MKIKYEIEYITPFGDNNYNVYIMFPEQMKNHIAHLRSIGCENIKIISATPINK